MGGTLSILRDHRFKNFQKILYSFSEDQFCLADLDKMPPLCGSLSEASLFAKVPDPFRGFWSK